MTRKQFGLGAELITVSDTVSVSVTNYGAAIVGIVVPDKNGRPTDVVLGFNSADEYRNSDKYIGATAGRYAGRICNGRFTLNGTTYQLAKNNGDNHLHGGIVGFSRKIWRTEKITDNCVIFALTSPDGEENYPGDLNVSVEYRVKGSSLHIIYKAKCNKDTVLNITNHSYFNLGEPIQDTYLKINADKIAEIGENMIPTSKFINVKGTPFDFSDFKPIGKDINAHSEQLEIGKGYDHTFILNGDARAKKLCATAYSEKSGIKLNILTDMPSVQFYSGNFLNGKEKGKNGLKINARDGFCLETQFIPDSPNKKQFPSCILKKDAEFISETELSFETI